MSSEGKEILSGNDQVEFNLTFQLGILKLALTDDHFCTRMVRYLGKDIDMRGSVIFADNSLQIIFKIIVDTFEELQTRPSRGNIEQQISAYDDNDNLFEAIKAIYEVDVHDDAFYKNYLGSFVKDKKLAKGLKKIVSSWEKDRDQALPILREIVDNIERISFEQDDIVKLQDFEGILAQNMENTARKIPTGIPKLDEDTVGGLPRETLVIVLGGTNVGKSIFCISLACEALRAKSAVTGENLGLKVLHINLEGERTEALKRYMANLARVDFKSIAKGVLSEEERERVQEVNKNYGERFKIRNMLGFGTTIEDVVAYCREEHKNFPFDILILDYGQLLETSQDLDFRHAMAKVHRGLDSIAKELGCVSITPVQATRSSQSEQFGNKGFNKQANSLPTLRATDVSEAFEIARVSAVILTLNRTDQEGKENKLRVFLEKQREGAKNITYGCYVNYGQSNLITGKFYDPFNPVEDLPTGEKESSSSMSEMVGEHDPKKKEKEQFLEKYKTLVNASKRKINTLDKLKSQLKDLEEQDPDNKQKIKMVSTKISKAEQYLIEIGEKATKNFEKIFPEIKEIDIQALEKEIKEVDRESLNAKEKEDFNEKLEKLDMYRLGLRGSLEDKIEDIDI